MTRGKVSRAVSMFVGAFVGSVVSALLLKTVGEFDNMFAVHFVCGMIWGAFGMWAYNEEEPEDE